MGALPRSVKDAPISRCEELPVRGRMAPLLVGANGVEAQRLSLAECCLNALVLASHHAPHFARHWSVIVSPCYWMPNRVVLFQ